MREKAMCRTDRVIERVNRLRIRRERVRLGALSGVCLLLTLCLVSVAYSTTGNLGDGMMDLGLFGAVILHKGAGGYVLAGLIAFAAGVIITVICIKSRHKKD